MEIQKVLYLLYIFNGVLVFLFNYFQIVLSVFSFVKEINSNLKMNISKAKKILLYYLLVNKTVFYKLNYTTYNSVYFRV